MEKLKSAKKSAVKRASGGILAGYRRCPYADSMECPLSEAGPGLSVEMVYTDGTVDYLPFALNVDVSHIPGFIMRFVQAAPGHSLLLVKSIMEAWIDWHCHTESAESIMVTAGTVLLEKGELASGDDVRTTFTRILEPGDSEKVEAGVFHRLKFHEGEGENSECVVVWRPPMGRRCRFTD